MSSSSPARTSPARTPRALALAAAWVLLRLGERIYQRAVFQGGRSLTWREAARLEQ